MEDIITESKKLRTKLVEGAKEVLALATLAEHGIIGEGQIVRDLVRLIEAANGTASFAKQLLEIASPETKRKLENDAAREIAEILRPYVGK